MNKLYLLPILTCLMLSTVLADEPIKITDIKANIYGGWPWYTSSGNFNAWHNSNNQGQATLELNRIVDGKRNTLNLNLKESRVIYEFDMSNRIAIEMTGSGVIWTQGSKPISIQNIQVIYEYDRLGGYVYVYSYGQYPFYVWGNTNKLIGVIAS